MTAHGRFERLAVGHVLGGLDQVDAAAFRAHLLDCRDCRRRVNELRDIANDLAATERDERRAAMAATVEVETRTEQDEGSQPQDAEPAPVRSWPWGIVVVALVPLLVLGMLAWAVWQRTQTDISNAVAESQDRVLTVLREGEPVAWTSAEAVAGDIAAGEGSVALNLTGVPELRPDEGLVIWLLGEDGENVARSRPFLPSQLDGSLVATIGRSAAATDLVVSIEADVRSLESLERPSGYELVTGPLPQVQSATEAPSVGASP